MEQTDLECLGNKLNNIDHITIRKRLNRELSTLIVSGFCSIDHIEIEKEEEEIIAALEKQLKEK